MAEPVPARFVVCVVARCEVIEHNRSADGEPTVGGVERRVVPWLLALAAAIQDEEIERPEGTELGPIAVDDADIRLAGEETGRRLRSCRIDLDADKGSRGVGRVNHPGQPDAAPGSRLADPATDVTTSKDGQQPTLFRRAGVVESLRRCYGQRSSHQLG